MTTLLTHTLAEARAVVHRLRLTQQSTEKDVFEDCVEITSDLVEPVLFSLGWNPDDEQEFIRHDNLEGFESLPAFELRSSDGPVVLIVVRSLGRELMESETLSDLLNRANVSKTPWVILTDGDEYRIYASSSENNDSNEALFGIASVTDDAQDLLIEFLDLFSKSRMNENRIEAIWRARMVDRSVRDAVEKLLVPDRSFVRMLERRIDGLSAREIRQSLERAEVAVKFATAGDVVSTSKNSENSGSEARSRMSEAELRIATWLQQRSIERWAKGNNDGRSRQRNRQRRVLENRRASRDRRKLRFDRRLKRDGRKGSERRLGERRTAERRSMVERRVAWDRRRARREA